MRHDGLIGVAYIEIVDADNQPQYRVEIDDRPANSDRVARTEIVADQSRHALAHDAQLGRAADHREDRADNGDQKNKNHDPQRAPQKGRTPRALAQGPAGLLGRVLVQAHVQIRYPLPRGIRDDSAVATVARPLLNQDRRTRRALYLGSFPRSRVAG